MDANHSFLPKYESFDYGNGNDATIKLENQQVQSQNVSLANSLKSLRSSSGQVFNEYNDFILIVNAQINRFIILGEW